MKKIILAVLFTALASSFSVSVEAAGKAQGKNNRKKAWKENKKRKMKAMKAMRQVSTMGTRAANKQHKQPIIVLSTKKAKRQAKLLARKLAKKLANVSDTKEVTTVESKSLTPTGHHVKGKKAFLLALKAALMCCLLISSGASNTSSVIVNESQLPEDPFPYVVYKDIGILAKIIDENSDIGPGKDGLGAKIIIAACEQAIHTKYETGIHNFPMFQTLLHQCMRDLGFKHFSLDDIMYYSEIIGMSLRLKK